MKKTADEQNIDSADIINKNQPPKNKNGIAKRGIKPKGLSVLWKRTIIVILMIVVLLGLLYLVLYSYLDKFQFDESSNHLTQEAINEFDRNQQQIDADLISGLDEIVIETPQITPTPAPTPVPRKELRYILLIGIDSRSSTNFEKASSDVMKVLVIDEEQNELKLLSLMRDILVRIDGQLEEDGTQKYGKLNAVYFFNGPDGLCESIKENFQIPVDEYVIINWNGVEEVVNAVGGVEINIKPSEIKCMNQEIRYQRNFKALEYANTIYKSGLQILDGNQALAYCRIRHCGNGDYDRVKRQVTVIKSIFESLRTASLEEILILLDVMQQVVKTNINPADLIKYAEIGYGMLDAEISSIEIPYGAEGEIHTAGKYKGRYVLKLDFPAHIQVIQDFIDSEDFIVDIQPETTEADE